MCYINWCYFRFTARCDTSKVKLIYKWFVNMLFFVTRWRTLTRTIIIIELVDLQPPTPLTCQASEKNITSMRHKSLITIFSKYALSKWRCQRYLQISSLASRATLIAERDRQLFILIGQLKHPCTFAYSLHFIYAPLCITKWFIPSEECDPPILILLPSNSGQIYRGRPIQLRHFKT